MEKNKFLFVCNNRDQLKIQQILIKLDGMMSHCKCVKYNVDI